MTPELTALALAALLQAVQFVLYAIPANLELGPGYTMSARDRPPSREMSAQHRPLGPRLEQPFRRPHPFHNRRARRDSRPSRLALHSRLRLGLSRRPRALYSSLCL